MAEPLFESPENYSRREIDRSAIEKGMIYSLVEIAHKLNMGETDEELKNDYFSFSHNLRKKTQSWQELSSGTIGEVMARWVGLGILEDFPEFFERAPEDFDFHNPVKSEKTEDKFRLKVDGTYTGEDEKYVFYRYKFNLDEKSLVERQEWLSSNTKHHREEILKSHQTR